MSYVDRMKTEREDLNQKIVKLEDFMDDRFVENFDRLKSITPANKILMWKQLHVMREYRDILDCRIELNDKI